MTVTKLIKELEKCVQRNREVFVDLGAGRLQPIDLLSLQLAANIVVIHLKLIPHEATVTDAGRVPA